MKKLEDIISKKQMSNMTMLEANDGDTAIILLDYEYQKPRILIRADKDMYRVCTVGGESSGGGKHEISFEDFWLGTENRSFRIYMRGDDVFLLKPRGFEFLSRTTLKSANQSVIELPDVEILTHIAKTDKGYYVITNKQFTFNQQVYFVGNDGITDHYPGADIQTYRDGGTTIAVTNTFEIKFPVNFNNKNEAFLTIKNDGSDEPVLLKSITDFDSLNGAFGLRLKTLGININRL